MRVLSFISALLLASGTAVTARGADLTKIDRTIAKQPAYKNKPKYCLVVFGPEAKSRVWLVQDGDVLYVDKNGNGDLTDKREQCPAEEPQDKIAREYGAQPADEYRVWNVGDIVEPDGKTRHTGLEVSHSAGIYMLRVQTQTYDHRHEYVPGGFRLQFADRPQDAPIVHFAGPLAGYLRTRHPLIRGQSQSLWATLGTRGLGNGAFAIIFDGKLYAETELLGEIEFPAKVAGGEPIRVKINFGIY